jgi:hypothetical protein
MKFKTVNHANVVLIFFNRHLNYECNPRFKKNFCKSELCPTQLNNGGTGTGNIYKKFHLLKILSILEAIPVISQRSINQL